MVTMHPNKVIILKYKELVLSYVVLVHPVIIRIITRDNKETKTTAQEGENRRVKRRGSGEGGERDRG